MKISTIIGLKYGSLAALAWVVTAFTLGNSGLRMDVLLFIAGAIFAPVAAVMVSRAAYKAGKQSRPAIEVHDA